MKRITCIICLMLVVGGCSTLLHGPTQEIVVTSNPPGAIVTPTDYKCWVKTPGIITLDRNQGTTLTARLYGYEDMKIKIKWGVSPWAMGNMAALEYPWLIMGCQPVAAIWALDADSIGELSPTEIHFELVPKKYVSWDFKQAKAKQTK